ncbi:MAG: DUF4097 domain-containing protein [Phycisphaerae bacterium]
MKTRFFRNAALLSAAALLSGLAACDSFTLTLTFVTPEQAKSVDTQTVALPDGARVVINNDTGSTRISVDPAATEATVQITKVAFGEDQAAADDLLSQIVVTMTPPTPEDNTLRIDAPRPPQATGNSQDFQASLVNDELNVTAILGGNLVSTVRLRITLPPGHGVDVTQQTGYVRATDLDTDSTLQTDNGSVRVTDATTAVTVRTDNGSVDIEDHAGSLDVRTDNGRVRIQVRSLAPDQQILARTDNGFISIELPRDIDAELSAMTDNGAVRLDIQAFDLVNNLSATRRSVSATLNAGGPRIDLNTDNGVIGIESR